VPVRVDRGDLLILTRDDLIDLTAIAYVPPMPCEFQLSDRS
jgi:hypothetical protein